MQNDYFNITFLNCQSFTNKQGALANDFNIRGSSVVGFADTKFKEGEELDLNGFDEHYFLSCNDRPSLGLAAYSKMEATNQLNYILYNEKHNPVASLLFLHFEKLFNLDCPSFTLVICYVSPKSSNDVYSSLSSKILDYLKNFRSHYSAVVGDFNRSPNEILSTFGSPLLSVGLKQLIDQPTHDHGKILDHLYSNLPSSIVRSGTLDSLTNTDHRPIYVSIKKQP